MIRRTAALPAKQLSTAVRGFFLAAAFPGALLAQPSETQPTETQPVPDEAPAPPAEPAPDLSAEGLEEGDIVERGGVLYEVKNSELVEIGSFGENTPRGGAPVYETSVTGSRVDDASNPVVRTDVIGSERIAETGARNVGEVLERVGGVQVTSSVGTGQTVSLDGVDSKYVLILIDGRPVNGQTNDRVDISRLPVVASEIKRIEIVRGPMSALYGSEALGGVINIITRRPRSGLHGEIEYGLRLTGQGLQRNAINGSISGGFKGALLRVSGSGLVERATDVASDENGFVVMKPDGALDLPHRRQGTLSAELTLYPTDVWKIQTYGRLLYNELETRLAASIPNREHTRDMQLQVGTQIEAEVYTGHTLTLDVRLDRYTHRFAKLPDGDEKDPAPFCEDAAENDIPFVVDDLRFRYFDAECPAPTRVTTAATQDDARVDARYAGDIASGYFLVEDLKVSAGMLLTRQNWFRFNGDGENTLPGSTGRSNGALYGELFYKPFSFLSLLPGFRADLVIPGAREDLFAFALGPKISARVDLLWGLAFRASYGQGFRMPSFSEQYLRFDHTSVGYIVEGNDDLTPENSHGLRGELSWTTKFLALGAEGYVNFFQNMIGFRIRDQTAEGVPIYTYENIDRATTGGLNLRAMLPTTFGFSGDVTYQYLAFANDVSGCPEDDVLQSWFCPVGDQGGAQRLFLRPTHSLHLGARYTEELTDTTFFTQMDYISERIIDEDGNKAPQTFRLAAGLNQKVFDYGEMILTFDNLTGSYHPVYGPKPGRSVMATFRAWF